MNAVVRATLAVLGIVALALLLWKVSYALLLGFGAVLFAVFLYRLAGLLEHGTGLGRHLSIAVIALGLLGLLAGAAALVGPAVAHRFDELGDTVMQGVERLQGYLENTTWGQRLLEVMSQGVQQNDFLIGAAGRVLVSAVDAMLALVLVIVAGVYLAVSPGFYREGVVHLVPKRHQPRAREVLRATGDALWLWLLGQFVIMASVGVLTTIGLLIVGVPLAAPLGLVAGLLEFIPFLGPFLAAVPILLVALTESPMTALWAVVALVVIQQVESNVLAPLVERWAVSLPPVLILLGTIALALLFGVLGVIFAAPLLVVLMIWTKMLYMENVLGEQVQLPQKNKNR